jgi:transposase
VLEELGARVHLAHTLGNNWGNRRVKNDERDAQDLAAMLRLGRLAEAWIAPPPVRELRELVRDRFGLVHHRSSCNAQVQGVMAKNGVLPVRGEMSSPAGNAQLDALELPLAYSVRIESLRDLITYLDKEVASLDGCIHAELKNDRGCQAIQQIQGVGRVIGAIFVAEIGDVSRFRSPEQLCSWAGLTPEHRQSDEHVVRGRITKQDSPLVRWAAVEAVTNMSGANRLQVDYHRIADRRGKGIGRVAAARKLLTLVSLLRPARRRDPLLAAGRRGGVSRIGHSQSASWCIGLTPTIGGVVD